MPRHEITGPDGTEYYVDGPEGSTREDAIRLAPRLLAEGKLHLAEPQTTKEPTQLQADLGSLGRAAAAFPGSVAKAGEDLWYTVTHADEVIKAVKEKGFSGIAADVGADLKEHYGSIERAKKTFETDPFRFVTDISVPITGGASALAKAGLITAKVARRVLPEVGALTSGAERSALRGAAEAGRLGGPEAAEFRAGVAGRPSPAPPTGPAAAAIAQRAQLAPFRQAGEDVSRWLPEKAGETALRVMGGGALGVPWWAAPTLSPRVMGEASYAAGALERGLSRVPAGRLTRAAIASGALDLLKDREAKKELSNDELRTVRAASKDDATSEQLMRARAILAQRMSRREAVPRVTAQVESAFGGTDAAPSVATTRATVPQTPSPGEASQPKPAAAPAQPQLSEVPPMQTAELPERTDKLQSLWDKLLKGGEKAIQATPGLMRGSFIPPMAKSMRETAEEARRQSMNVLRGEDYDPRAPLEMATQVMGAGVPAAERGALGAAGGKLITPEGLAIKGKEFTKTSQKALEEIKQMPKGAGPLELKGELRSDVPQTPIPRYEPPSGVSPRMQQALANPKVVQGVLDSMRVGMRMGADKWYLNEPIRMAFLRELGQKEGPREFARFMDYVAATSPRSDVPTNIRNASYYYLMTGKELPKTLPYPYGHMAQKLHRGNISQLEQHLSTAGAEHVPEYRGWDIFKNPKPVSFSEDLQGNLIPVAADTHAVRNITMRTGDPRFLETQIQEALKGGPKTASEFQRTYGEIAKTPKGVWVARFRPQELVKSGRMSLKEAQKIPPFWVGKPTEREYAAVEKFYSDLSEKLKLAPAQGQSAAWSGAGELTGLGTVPDQTFVEMFNNRILYTAMMRGENPMATLRAFIRKQKPLLGFGGTGLLGSKLLQEREDEPTRR